MDIKTSSPIAGRIKYRQVSCFLEVAERRSFVRAAEALHTTQPAVSKTIAELEEALGVVLLERSRRGVHLTAYGEVFRRHAGASVAALRQGVESLVSAQAGGALRVAIGVLPTVAAAVMPRAIKRAKERGLSATVYLAPGTNDVLLGLLKAKELDLVVGRFADSALMRGLVFEHLYSEQITIVGRAGHPLADRQHAPLGVIKNYTVVLPETGSIIRPTVDTLLRSRGLSELSDVIETTSPTFGRAYLRLSDAIWIISRGVVADDLQSGELIELPIDVDVVTGPVGLTMRADAAPTLPIQIIRDAIHAVTIEIGLALPGQSISTGGT
ncbi:pca operon transcription factor PcaQ [Bradyrhizobium jicamae]|uniref:pca operon transcription factor PcaQ n=1 Tax=Bradyrhizobium jicamae TaxID=280332 RepID=UPI001BA55DFE|nr:pca operon transcription factor PcaQ [Bradyrhizobium jicamae]MBR0933714.1 pca operon transcription factor PcaQ [Bradyrhizobium jicamae]